jgi:inner membrane protein
LLLAAALRWCFANTRPPGGWKWLWPLALGGIVVHIAGDWITQFGTMLLEPLSDRRFGLGAMFIIDLVFTGLLLAGLVLCAVLPRQRWPAVAGLAAAAAWVGVAWTGQQEALHVGERFAQARAMSGAQVTVMPRPASPFNWTVTVFDGTRYHVAHVNTRRAEPLMAGEGANFIRRFSAPYGPERLARWQVVERFGPPGTPQWVQQAWAHPALATYRWFAQTPALQQALERPAAGGGLERCAVFRDLRFEFPGRGDPPFRYGLCLQPDGSGRAVRLEGSELLPV